MAISAFVIFDVRTTGSDSANGGGFDPSVTAGMNSDGAATSGNTASPVFTSASYNFVAGDVGAFVYVASGTNWISGWYEIVSVAANAATLNATAGVAAFQQDGNAYTTITADGCASVASPTNAVWTIDYSQQNAAARSYTDLASAGAGLTVSSAAFPFGRQMVGNMLVIDSGTNFTAGNYIIASVAAVTFIATVTGAGNITTGIGASGVGGMGGAMATPGKAKQRTVAGNKMFIKNGTYTLTTNTVNTSGGPLSNTLTGTANNVQTIVGWSSIRTVWNSGTPAEINAGARTGFTMMSVTGAYWFMRNLILDGNNGASTTLLSTNGNFGRYTDILARNFTVVGINFIGGSNNTAWYCRVTGGSPSGFIINSAAGGNAFWFCEAYNNTGNGFRIVAGTLVNCISYGNTGGSSYGFYGEAVTFINCVAYDNAAGGYSLPAGSNMATFFNCIAESNSGVGWDVSAVRQAVTLYNCAGYDNTGGDYSTTNVYPANVFDFKTGSGSFFTDAANDDFSLNNTAGAGALLRGTGYPQLYPQGLTASYPDIGVSEVDSGGASGGLLVNPGMSGGMRG